MAVRLQWDGKPDDVERLNLPFQIVETVNESRATRERDTGSLLRGPGATVDERNQLIWGDNKLVMSSLLQEYAGKVKLIYIDPPFDTGADFSYKVKVGESSVEKLPSILEEHAYRDTWAGGADTYLTMMYERLVLMRELLSDDGSLYVHCDWRVSAYLRLILDDIFGPSNFRNEIIWSYRKLARRASQFPKSHDVLLFYTKTASNTFNVQFVGLSASTLKRWGDRKRGGKDPSSRFATDEESQGAVMPDVWDVPLPIGANAQKTGYPTQKPEALLERVITASSNPGDLVADFFVGSGTTAAVAEMLGRRWIACDLGRFAIHTTRKRLLNVPDCRAFDIKNLGAYERQRWQVASGNGALRAYLDTILAFYRAEPFEGFAQLHGRKAGRVVHVGATDAPVTIDEAEDVMDEMADNGIEACDLLGWEWEMGLHDTITERARRRGLDLRPRQIPREVMERQAIEADAVRFFELAHVDLDVRRQGHEACVVLKDFAIPSEDLIPPKVRESVRSWSDLIDYWSVDFDFSDEVFHNQWQAYRTREIPTLATESDWHEYSELGRYAIVVKIIDIFGNDTTKLAEVRIK